MRCCQLFCVVPTLPPLPCCIQLQFGIPYNSQNNFWEHEFANEGREEFNNNQGMCKSLHAWIRPLACFLFYKWRTGTLHWADLVARRIPLIITYLFFCPFSLNIKPISPKPIEVCWDMARLVREETSLRHEGVGKQPNFSSSCQRLPGQRRWRRWLQLTARFGWSGLRWRTPAGPWWSWHLSFCT